MDAPPREVLEAWGLSEARAQPIPVGLINRTFLVEHAGERRILQRLHPVFRPEVNLDIDAVTAHLEARGVPTPRPIPTGAGDRWVDAPDGTWRMLSYVEGRVVHTVQSPRVAREAGALLARFHRALADLDHRFHFTRPAAHDTPQHLVHLAEALADHADHRLASEIRPVAERILEHGAELPPIPPLPQRIVHGDPKITNVLFDEALEHAVALVDLDTLAHGTLAVELGDALRSWCNPAGEEAADATLALDLFDGAVRGWAEAAGDLPTEDEVGSIVPGVETIALELASRFCADALEERYFAWDGTRFESRAAHNLARARSQLSLAASIRAARGELERRVRSAFAR